MAERVTIQDIADAVGVSRNTVSKAINNTGVISEATRNSILKKAAELGYKQFSYMTLPQNNITQQPDIIKGDIAFLTGGMIDGSHFASTMLDRIQKQAVSEGFGFAMYRALPSEIQDRILPASMDLNQISGIICVEMFDIDYCRMLCSLSIPILFVDSPVVFAEDPLPADILIMDNENCIYKAVRTLKSRGKKTFGFVGEIMHCRSFFERYRALKNALDLHGLVCDDKYFITETAKENGYSEYQPFLRDSIFAMKELPEVLFFANDYVCLQMLPALREKGIKVPSDLMLVGFDDSPIAKVIHPELSTIHIHSQIMGYAAMNLLLSRIQDPALNYRTMHTETSLYLRESTGD
ncbi:MAG: LacI family DNA-binding transcriptional regulator [Lachnospiraceae bacterium]|nr:LacI family DNA-binding transcriptional regulator [Lachnospiraceae bacterium]